MQTTSTARQPLSRKNANVRLIDLDGISSKHQHLSLSKSNATQKPLSTRKLHVQPDHSVTNDSWQQQQHSQLKRNSMSLNSGKGHWRQENGEIEVIPSSSLKVKTEDCLSSDEDLQRHKRVLKPKKPVAKGIKSPSSSSYKVSAKKEILMEDAHDLRIGGNDDSPIYQKSSILTSSPVSPLFYEKIKPIVRRQDAAASASASHTNAVVESHSPLAGKHRGNQEDIQNSNLISRTDKSWKGKQTQVSRSLLPELTSTVNTTLSAHRQTIPHVSRRRATDKTNNSKRDERNAIQTFDASHIPAKIPTNTNSRVGASLPDPYLQTCPICDAEFPTSIIEEHADECIGTLAKEPTQRTITSQQQLTQSLLAPLKRTKSFTVYNDNAESQTRPIVIGRPAERQEEKECPICHVKIRADLLQSHVEEELDELSSGSVPSNTQASSPVMSNDDNTQSSAVGKIPEPMYSISVSDESDSECSVIDLASGSNAGNSETQTSGSNPIPRQRSLSPVEGFQDIRQLQNDDPGYQMYFRQFGDARLDSGKSRKRRNQTAGGGEPGVTPTTSKRKPNRNYRKFRGKSSSRRPRQRAGRAGRN
jgi:hypothetical protein